VEDLKLGMGTLFSVESYDGSLSIDERRVERGGRRLGFAWRAQSSREFNGLATGKVTVPTGQLLAVRLARPFEDAYGPGLGLVGL